ncbi:hypothetical protein IC575_028360 [Cucumis melo]
MVMPIGISGRDKNSMFQTSPFEFNEFKNNCKDMYGVTPRPHWITTFYGGQVNSLTFHTKNILEIFFSTQYIPNSFSLSLILENIIMFWKNT